MDRGGRGNKGDGQRGLFPAGLFASDHLGVNANYNRCTPGSTPLSPVAAGSLYPPCWPELFFDDPEPDETCSFGAHELTHGEIGNTEQGEPDFSAGLEFLSKRLDAPGALDWLILKDEGQYFVGLADQSAQAGFRLQIYSHRDLSIPILAYRDENTRLIGDGDQAIGKKYVLTDPPYFIKVEHEQHEFVGDFRIAVKRLTCTDKFAMACIMERPNVANQQRFFPSDGYVASSPTPESMYFMFDVQPASNNHLLFFQDWRLWFTSTRRSASKPGSSLRGATTRWR